MNYDEINAKEMNMVVYYGNIEVHTDNGDTPSIWYS